MTICRCPACERERAAIKEMNEVSDTRHCLERVFPDVYQMAMEELSQACQSKRAAGVAQRGETSYQHSLKQFLEHDILNEIEQELLDIRNYVDDYFIQKAIRKMVE